jgi:hypothetical protein
MQQSIMVKYESKGFESYSTRDCAICIETTCILIMNKKLHNSCRNPSLAKCGGEAQHLEKVRIWSPPGLPNVQSSTSRLKTPRIAVFLVSLERSWSVDIEYGLASAIWTSLAQVMGKRRAGSQTGSLTPDH